MLKKSYKKHRTRNQKVKKHRTRNQNVKKHRTRNQKVKKHRSRKNIKGGYNYNGWPLTGSLASCNHSSLGIHPGCERYCCQDSWTTPAQYSSQRCYGCNHTNEFNRPQSP